MILGQIRLPRTLLGLAVGAVLALSGVAMQGLFRNPLADPGLVGVASGAALGAAVAIVGGSWLGGVPEGFAPYLLSACAFIGGLGVTALVYRLGRREGQTNVATMLLAGIALTALGGSAVGLFTYLADDATLRTLTFWNLGSLNGASYERLWPLLLITAGWRSGCRAGLRHSMHYCSVNRRRGIWASKWSGSSASWCSVLL